MDTESNTLQIATTALHELKANDIVSLDVKSLTSITDHMLIASGTSNRHVKSIADKVVTNAKHNGIQPLGVEGLDTAEWVLIDLGDVIVHVMLPATREFYDLERLWSQIASGNAASE